MSGQDLNRSGATVIGQFKSARIPIGVKVWIGRDVSIAAADDAQLSAQVFGLFIGDQPQAVDLAAEPSSSVTLEGVRWTRYSAVLEEGPVGWAMLSVTDLGMKAFQLAGPVAVEAEVQNAGAALRPAKRRPLSDREQKLWDDVGRRQRENLQVRAPRPIEPFVR